MTDFRDYQAAAAVFQHYGISLTEQQHRTLCKFEALLSEENENVQNLTAVTESNEIWIRHFLDSAAIIQYLPEHATIIDLGTGGGIPGIPLAVLRPDLQITLLDSEKKKLDFCESAAERTEVNVKCLWGRAEELARKPEYREKYDIVVSRAMASCTVLFELGVPFLKQDGILLAMKGRSFDPEAERMQSAANSLNLSVSELIHYEIEGEPKTLVRVQKSGTLSDIYPRRFAKIKRNPL